MPLNKPIRTKIVATLGPASDSPEMISQLLDAGVDVFRLNMSHSNYAWHGRIVRTIRSLASRADRAISILADLQGPRIRVGEIPGGPMHLRSGMKVSLLSPEVKAQLGQIPVTYDRFCHDVKVGESILLDDGQIELQVLSKSADRVQAKVRYGGLLRPFKGINMPGSKVSAPSLTEKDLADLNFILKQKVDWIGLSFARSAEDIIRLKAKIHNSKSKAQVVAKIERPEAIKDLDRILLAADAVMVARGDLGVEMGPAEVPILQKKIIHQAIELERPVITATQMLDSMTENPRPTRAEASDVANAILDGTDAIMLSGETARGKYPVQTVLTARRIAYRVEEELLSDLSMPVPHQRALEGKATVDEAAVLAGTSAAVAVGARLIVPFTETGRTAKLVASNRAPIPIVSFTFHKDTYHRMALFWGTTPAYIGKAHSLAQMYDMAEKYLLKRHLAKRGDKVLLVSGIGLVAGATNTMRVHQIS